MRYYVSKKTGVYELWGLILQINMILVLNIVVIDDKLLKHLSYSRNATVVKFVTHPHLYDIIKWPLWPIPYYIWHQFRIASRTLITFSTCYYSDLNPLNLQKDLSAFLTSTTLDLHLTGDGKSSLTEVA